MSFSGLLAVMRARVVGMFMPFVRLMMSSWVITSCIVLKSLSVNLSIILSILLLSSMYFPHFSSNSST